MASSEGGMDIEEVAHATPEKIIKAFVDPATGLTDCAGQEAGRRASACRQPRGASRRRVRRSSTSATWTPTPRWSRSTR
jgi:DNA-binding protein H-NS